MEVASGAGGVSVEKCGGVWVGLGGPDACGGLGDMPSSGWAASSWSPVLGGGGVSVEKCGRVWVGLGGPDAYGGLGDMPSSGWAVCCSLCSSVPSRACSEARSTRRI